MNNPFPLILEPREQRAALARKQAKKMWFKRKKTGVQASPEPKTQSLWKGNMNAVEQLDRQIAEIIQREYPEVLVWPHTRVMAAISNSSSAEESEHRNTEEIQRMVISSERQAKQRAINALLAIKADPDLSYQQCREIIDGAL